MSKRTPLKSFFSSPAEEVANSSPNPSFDSVLSARLSRRGILRGSLGGAASLMLGGAGALGLAGCGGGDDAPVAGGTPPIPSAPTEILLGFTAVAKSIADAFTVPAGYTAVPLIAVGDPLFNGVSPYANNGTDSGFDQRCGEWHDGMEYFGLSAAGARDDASNNRALLGINHEWVSNDFLHVNGPTLPTRPASEVDIEADCMGVSIVEIAKGANGRFAYVQGSTFNRRITTLTEIEFAGPARGHPKLVTKFSTDGTKTRGTVNNCGTGKTPWGTLLTGEENWTNFFARNAGDDTLRTAQENLALTRFGRPANRAHVYRWDTVTPTADKYARWNTSVSGATAADDYRNEINGQGYITEIDPYNPTSVIKKRTTMGRMAHEGAAFSLPVAGQPLAIYMGDDAQNEYIYKFVSSAVWDPADANRTDRMAVGDKYLDSGTLYAAKFDAAGNGTWLPLDMSNPLITGYPSYTFADIGDILIHARVAADAAGATKMDRPEWSYTNPANGEVYITLTNNSNRRLAPTGTQVPLDPSNPRAYNDVRGGTSVLNGNVNGHIVRLKDAMGDPTAASFSWDIYLFGAESDADTALVNLSGLTADQDFSSPDGIVFTGSTGRCWIQTDDGAYVDESNCMMLAAVPGQIGDGGPLTLNYGATSVTTQMGAKPSASTLKRFLVGPVGQEITGLAESPDGKVIFVNVQHPEGNWPANAGYGPGGATGRPRSATVMITKNDGGRIGT